MRRTCRLSPELPGRLDRRDFLKIGGAAGFGLWVGNRSLSALAQQPSAPPPRPKTNIEDALRIPRTRYSLPGLFPATVVEVQDAAAIRDDKPVSRVVYRLVEKGLNALTQKSGKDSFGLFFNRDDVVGIKVNPVGPGTISTHLEVVDALVDWLTAGGLERKNIIIWDRFDYMLRDAGYTAERYPGLGIEGLQTMDEAAAMGKTDDNSRWLKPDGTHISAANFDQGVYYWADVEAPQDNAYLNQHVFNGKFSYFGSLLTKRLTKLINVPVFKNTGNGISMATKNLGYGAVCNTNRLHAPLFFDVNTEVMAFPAIRDKLVLNITDGLRGQYDGGPEYEGKFAYWLNTLFFATDPFALDMICHQAIVAKRKSMGVKVNEHPKFTEYLRYAERLGLGVVDPAKIRHIRV
jgi:Domain of unknown function (DUF362)